MGLPKRIKRKFLDEELLFKRMYVTMGAAGSLGKLQNWYTGEFGVNPNTGKPFSREALFQAMWRWALDNLEEARNIYMVYVSYYGESLSKGIWKQTVSSRAIHCLHGGAKKFFAKNPEYILPENEPKEFENTDWKCTHCAVINPPTKSLCVCGESRYYDRA